MHATKHVIETATSTSRVERVRNFLGLERNVAQVSVAMLLMGLGENLWKKFLPKYLEALGAPISAIGLFGTTEDFLDGVYQYPGGWLSDHLGRRKALLLVTSAASVGYLIYWLASSWPYVFLGLAFVMAWSSMASPTLFSVIADALPKQKRAMGFTIQSMLKRLPMVVAPVLGGLLIARHGILAGVRIGLLLTITLAMLTFFASTFVAVPTVADETKTNVFAVWRSLPGALRRLLVSDIFIRTCEGMVDVFLVLYATNVLHVSSARFGILVAVQMLTAMAVYIPAGHLADRIGRKPFVIATFLFFALFPVTVVLSHSFLGLIGAFFVGGLREIGEPARKAMILDSVEPILRGRSVGLYYLLRSLAISPAAFVGGLLWEVTPSLPFYTAGVIGLVGTLVFFVTVNEKFAA